LLAVLDGHIVSALEVFGSTATTAVLAATPTFERLSPMPRRWARGQASS
jgi:hypothetical protein